MPGAAGRARRSAVRELERTGLVQIGRLELADRASGAEHFRRVRRCMKDDEAPEVRDWELLLLLAWSGVLIHRLGRHDRRIALRQLRLLVPSPEEGESWQPPGGEQQEMPAWITTLGGISAM